MSRIFVVLILEDFAWDFLGGFFWALFSHKNEEKTSGEKIREKIRRLKVKIHEKSVLFHEPALTDKSFFGDMGR